MARRWIDAELWSKLPKGWTKLYFLSEEQQTGGVPDKVSRRRAKRRDELTKLVWKTTSTGIYFRRKRR